MACGSNRDTPSGVIKVPRIIVDSCSQRIIAHSIKRIILDIFEIPLYARTTDIICVGVGLWPGEIPLNLIEIATVIFGPHGESLTRAVIKCYRTATRSDPCRRRIGIRNSHRHTNCLIRACARVDCYCSRVISGAETGSVYRNADRIPFAG